MKKTPKILAFAGSARKDSLNKKLVKIAVAAAKSAGADVNVLDLARYDLPIYNADLEKEEGIPRNALEIKKMMIEADGFLIASPEYNSSITPLLKNVIDWASRASEGESPLICYKDKIVCLMSASPGKLGGLRALVHVRAILENIGCLVLPDQRAISQAHEAFLGNGKLKNEKDQKAIEDLGEKLVQIIEKLK